MKEISQNTPPHAPSHYPPMMYQHHGDSSFCYPEPSLSMYGDRSRIPHSSGKSYDYANVMWPNCKIIFSRSCLRSQKSKNLEKSMWKFRSGWVMLHKLIANFNALDILIYVLHVSRVLWCSFCVTLCHF